MLPSPLTSHFTLPLCVILTISDRRSLLSPKTLSLFHGCLMIFYLAHSIVFTFPCMFKKRFKRKQLSSEYLCQLKGRLICCLPGSHPPPLSLFLSSPHLSLFSRSYIFTKVPFSLLSFHQRLSKGALILKAGLA